jgi:hypothetical protein
MLWGSNEGQHQGNNLSCGKWAYRKKSNGIDSQLINVGVTHDCDRGMLKFN